ncbi:MAG: HlyD family secretion protein [Chitinophagales bacterium]|nr:HlyD family secretion protein [Chitinophagales bacterium]MCZ2392741.1 HlyD family secretion protein [Chitinophagales bacterium]
METITSTSFTEEKSTVKKKYIFITLILCILFFGLYYGYSKYQFNKSHQETDNAQVNGDIVPVVSRIPGFVDYILIEENSPIRQGEIILRLDDREMQIRLKQAQAGLNSTQKNIDVSKSSLGISQAGAKASNANFNAIKQNLLSAKAQIDGAKIKVDATEKEFKRFSSLLEQGATTQQIYDKVKAERDGALVQYDVAKNQYEVLLKQVAAAQDQLLVNQEQVSTSSSQVSAANSGLSLRELDIELLQLNLSHTIITAPVSGIISKKNVQLGQFIQPGQSLFAIISDSSLYITANFKETQIENMQVGQSAKVLLDAYPDIPIEGKVVSFSPATGAKFSLLPPDNATGNFTKIVQRVPVKISITIPESLKNKLKTGLSARVTVSTK